MIYKVNESNLYCIDNCGIVNDYYQNIVNLIIKIFQNNPKLNINIMLCDNYNFNNNNVTLRIDINYEHTLVKRGGRSVSDGTPIGDVDAGTNEKYLVRILDTFDNSHIIIDYSIPNIHNVNSCSQYGVFSKKHIYIRAVQSEFILTGKNIT